MLAVVEWWNSDRGFGVVRPDSSEKTAFVHITTLPGAGYRCLVAGERVLVTVRQEEREGRLQVSDLSYPPGRHAGVVAESDHLKGYGYIVDDETGHSVFVHYAEILGPPGARVTLIGGERVTFDVAPSDKGPMAAHVKRLDPRDPLDRFVRIPLQAWIILADLAEQQDVWVLDHPDDDDEPSEDAGADGHSSAGAGAHADLPVLRSYIHHTFARLIDDGKITYGATMDGRRAAFNTGLVTPNQEEIYGVLAEKPDDDGYAWRLLGWMKESDGRLAGVFSPRPPRARYWDDPDVLFYDSRRPLILDWDHFVKDNLSRYPETREAGLAAEKPSNRTTSPTGPQT